MFYPLESTNWSSYNTGVAIRKRHTTHQAAITQQKNKKETSQFLSFVQYNAKLLLLEICVERKNAYT
jgi:hypothetical protein